MSKNMGEIIMKKFEYIKKAIIGLSLGAVAIFGATVSARSNNNPASDRETVFAGANGIDGDAADKEKDAVSLGYMMGYNQGNHDIDHKHKYKDDYRVAYGDESDDTSVLPGGKLKAFFEKGYTR